MGKNKSDYVKSDYVKSDLELFLEQKPTKKEKETPKFISTEPEPVLESQKQTVESQESIDTISSTETIVDTDKTKNFLKGLINKVEITPEPDPTMEINSTTMIPQVVTSLEKTSVNYTKRNVASLQNTVVENKDILDYNSRRGIFKLKPNQPIKN
jgi:hypothetical protein